MKHIQLPISNALQGMNSSSQHIFGIFQIGLAFFVDKKINRIVGKCAKEGKQSRDLNKFCNAWLKNSYKNGPVRRPAVRESLLKIRQSMRYELRGIY